MLACQAIYHMLVLASEFNVLTRESVESYGDRPSYDADVDFSFRDFGTRLAAVRTARGLNQTQVARASYPAGTSADKITARASYLSRIERENENVSLETQIFLAKGLGFHSMSAFWIAIERAHDAASSSLHSATQALDSLPTSASAKGDVDAPALPTLADFERVVLGSTDTIVAELRRLTNLVDERLKPAPSPRANASHHSRSRTKGVR